MLRVDGSDTGGKSFGVAFQPGVSVGRYVLCERLASGGMGAVYLARMAGPGRFAKLQAIKLIHTHLVGEPEVVEMFLEEARLQSRINHPNVCTVTDFGHHEDNYFLAMEYLEGETLGDLAAAVENRPELQYSDLWISVAARLVMQACEGLHAAHEVRGPDGASLEVIHRDVSPANIFVTDAGSAKVMDFGVARAMDGEIHTMPGSSTKGRYAYMAPERARADTYDRRVDVWSLGVILWELLAFRRLFERSNPAQVIMAIAMEPIPDIRGEREDVPPELGAVIAKALAREPSERYLTAREMGRDLHRVLARLPEPVGAAEVAELMEAVFGDRLEQRRGRSERARQVDSGVVESPCSSPDTMEELPTEVGLDDEEATLVQMFEPADSGVRIAAPRLEVEVPPASPRPVDVFEPAARPLEPEAPRATSHWMVSVAVMVFVVALGAGLGFGLWALGVFDPVEPEPSIDSGSTRIGLD